MCTVCGRQFHRSDYLKLHSYSHTNERPFNCHICGKGFKMNYNLKVHLKNHETNDQPLMSICEDLVNISTSSNTSNSNGESFNDASANNIDHSNHLTSTEMVSFFIEDMDLSLRNNNRSPSDLKISKISLTNPIGLDTNTINLIPGEIDVSLLADQINSVN